MKKSVKWFFGIAGSLLLGVFSSFIYDAVKSYPFAKTLDGWWTAVKSAMIDATHAEVRIWIVLLVVVALAGLWWLISKSTSALKISEPDYLNYVQEKFDSYLWKWNWEKIDGYWDIINLSAYCPICETPLTYANSFGIQYLTCPRDSRHVPHSGQ